MDPNKRPLNLLLKHLNGNISVKLKNDIEYKGQMIQCDNYMNIILNSAAEYSNDGLVANYGNIFIRGNNILYICVGLT